MKKNKSSKIAAIQMCSSNIVDENLQQAAFFIRKAAANGAELIALPENFALMAQGHADRLTHKEPLGEGKIQNFLRSCAQQNKVWIVGGSIPIACHDPKKVKAACLIYNKNGLCVGHYNKIHLFDATITDKESHHESKFIKPGNNIIVLDTPVGKLGLGICFDVRFPSLFTQLAKKGVEIIVLPSAFTVPTGSAHWEILTRCRAIDTFAYLVAPAQGGTHSNGRKTYGHSVIIDPWGRIIAEKADSHPGIIYAEIDLNLVYQSRKSISLTS